LEASLGASENLDEGDSDDEKHDHELPGPAWQGLIFAMVPMLVILFGAGREAWSKGIAAVLMALVMLVFPVRRRLPKIAMFGLFGALLAPLLAFLPADWQLGLP
jgi:hypothetical protein